jgi:hypothetical protein
MVSVAVSVHQCRSVGLPVLPVHDSRDSSSDLHPTFCCCFLSSPLTSMHSLSPNGLAVGGIPCQDRDQMAQADWASGVLLRRLLSVLSVVVAEGSE